MVGIFCKALSAPGTALWKIFDGIEDLTASRGLALSDCLMSGIFGSPYQVRSVPSRGSRRAGQEFVAGGAVDQMVADLVKTVGVVDSR